MTLTVTHAKVSGVPDTGDPGDVLPSDWNAEHVISGDTVGAQGATGAQGAQGAAGTTGAQGAVGTTGAQGAVGTTGAQGAAGTTGAQGAVGTTGAQGAVGTTGAQGAAGTTGAQGAVGTTGAQGAAGTTGAQGAVGTTGAQGAVGTTGAQGAAGTTGAQGAVGTTGAQGAAGTTGAQGAVGTTGAQGAVGTTGAQGAAGTTGAQGAVGTTGAQGAVGTTGAQGAVGTTGAQGAVGTTGAQGAVGTTGAQGAVGTTGAQGAVGTTGAQGAVGTTGAQGAAGAGSSAAGFILGFTPQYTGVHTFGASSGTVYIEALGATISGTPADITVSPGGSIWLHVCVYSSNGTTSGTPTLEAFSGSDPVPFATPAGTARSKPSDTTRRYIYSVRFDGSGNILPFIADSAGSYAKIWYTTPTFSAPYRVLSAGHATSFTNIDLSSIAVPVMTAEAYISLGVDTTNTGSAPYIGLSLDASSYAAILQNPALTPGTTLNTAPNLIFVNSATPSIYYIVDSSNTSGYVDIKGLGLVR